MEGLYRPTGRLVWMFRYTRDGVQRRVSTGTRDESKAIDEARKILSESDAEPEKDADAEPKEGDAKAAIARYFRKQRAEDRLSVQTINARSPVLLDFFAAMGLVSVGNATRAHVQKWHDSLECSANSAQDYVRWLRAFYKWLRERGYVEHNPCEGVKMARLRPVARQSTVTKQEVKKLIDECEDPALKFVLFCGFHAGMRKMEVIEARPEWFDLKTNHIHIGPTATWIPKDRERRSVPISKAFADFLKDYGLRSPYMLRPELKAAKALYRYDFDRAYKSHRERCGVTCSFHDARRSFASHLVSAGVSVYKVARWLGDGVGVVEKHYGHLQPDNGDLERGLG